METRNVDEESTKRGPELAIGLAIGRFGDIQRPDLTLSKDRRCIRLRLRSGARAARVGIAFDEATEMLAVAPACAQAMDYNLPSDPLHAIEPHFIWRGQMMTACVYGRLNPKIAAYHHGAMCQKYHCCSMPGSLRCSLLVLRYSQLLSMLLKLLDRSTFVCTCLAL